MPIVIGLDFGNFNSYPSYIEDLDSDHRRLGGRAADLLPATEQEGVPSVFFYDGNGHFLAGRAAVSGAAKPERNRVRYLKRSLNQPLEIGGARVVIDGKAWTFNDAIREVAQSVLREANQELMYTTRQTTNLVSLAYPATFSSGDRECLIRIVESATLEDGRHFRVVGTIMEPAAAALDYLAQTRHKEDTTALVFDLGGGTFDLSLVTCYPDGKVRKNKSVAYYDIHVSDGLPHTGGREFDEVIYQLLHAKIKAFLSSRRLPMVQYVENQLRLNAEKVKKELSNADRTVYEAFIPALEDDFPFELTRSEFENAPQVVKMLRQMTDKARNLLENKRLPRPTTIVLTGGSCRMPMIRAALSKALPEYAAMIDGIQKYKPETAISYGAARYGIPEDDPDPEEVTKTGTFVTGGEKNVIKHTAYEIGIRFFRKADDDKGYIDPFIAVGTELPCTTAWTPGYLLAKNEYIRYRLYEANTTTPVRDEPDRDYRFIKDVKVHFGTEMDPGTRSEIRLVVDKDGLVTMEARKDKRSSPFTVQAQLTHFT